jgi:hypothetical protein
LYAGIVPYYPAVQERADNKTLFVCFRELSDPQTQDRTLQRMKQWLYPGSSAYSSYESDVATTTQRALTIQQQPKPSKESSSSYQGGHSTSKDPLVRQRLLALIAKLDHEVFQDRAAKATFLFGCG